MGNEELKAMILKVLSGVKLGSFATINEGKPWVRYVMVHTKDNLDMYFTTARPSRKIKQIEKNADCHITVGGDGSNFASPYVQIVGKAEVKTDIELKKEFWNDFLAQMFKGPEDPNYVIVKLKPELIEFWGMGKMEPQIYKP